jgi:uncharacterized protein
MDKLKNKNVVITGASAGIGLSIATLCAKSGANVTLLARRMDKLRDIQQDLQGRFGAKIHIHKLDVSNTNEVEDVFSQILEEIGHVDVLVNNAGYGTFKVVDETEMDEAKAMFGVNVIGLMACSKMVIPSMKKRKSGHIINVASIAGKIATPKSTLYSSTKFAVIGYSNALRMELLQDGINVTTINPGPIETDFFDIADETGAYVKNVSMFMLQPDYVASKIVSAMLTKRREVNLPGYMNAISKMYTLFPNIVELLGKRAFFKK